MGWGRKLLVGGGAIGGLALVGGVVAVVYASGSADERLRFPETPKPALIASQDPEVIARGKYLVHGPAHCASCHCNGEREHPEQILTAPLSGGLEFAMGPIGTRYARNLTPDLETGIGARTDAELARTLRTSVLHDGDFRS